jgi:hypothetical protein
MKINADTTINADLTVNGDLTVTGTLTADNLSADSASDPTPTGGGITYYIDSTATGADDGTSWADAWDSLDEVYDNRASFVPGDVILIAPGTYAELLDIYQMDGTFHHPITIAASVEAAGDGSGTVTIDGGRSGLLPYHEQGDYTMPDGATNDSGVWISVCSYIVLDGLRWGGFMVSGWGQNGVRIEATASHTTIRYLDSTNNGVVLDNGDGTHSCNPSGNGAGIRVNGQNMVVSHCRLYDNATDALQSHHASEILDLLVANCWLHNKRAHPSDTQGSLRLPFNWDSHTDGIQLYVTANGDGYTRRVILRHCVIGPGLTQAAMLTDDNNDIEAVSFENCLMVGLQDNGINSKSGTDADNVTVRQCTIVAPSMSGKAFRIGGTGDNINIIDTIVDGGDVYTAGGVTNVSYTRCYRTSGTTGTAYNAAATLVAPGWVAEGDNWASGGSGDFDTDFDYTPTDAGLLAAGAHSTIVSVAALLATGVSA